MGDVVFVVFLGVLLLTIGMFSVIAINSVEMYMKGNDDDDQML